MGTDKFKAYALVFIQGISIVLILLTGWPLAGYIPLLIIQIAGVILGIWAVVVMGRENTNITPLVKQDSHLVTNGPYAFIRHPMYSAVVTSHIILISFLQIRLMFCNNIAVFVYLASFVHGRRYP